MTTQTSLPPNQNQIAELLNNNNSFYVPNIRKAKFIRSTSRIYQLEFDQDIQMSELKLMIQKAAHLRKNSFTLVSEGQNYTQYNSETFVSLFPNKQLVIFTLEVINLEDTPDETELLLQINMPCPDHNYKFLLYYCFDCGKSICSECFIHGTHKGHRIQDKCFYLLPSKYLVEKMFDNWSQKPYEDFQISVDLNEYKKHLNGIVFKELFQLLLEVQTKCNNLIDKYNQINEKSLGNIRDSVRDIKVSCIKALDEYKNAINIKDIINKEEMFLDFDNTYKELGRQQKEKFKENLQKFQELNKSISILVQNLIDNICLKLKECLTQTLNNKQYDEIENKINMKLIRPVDKDQIMNQISDKKNKIKQKKYERKSMPSDNIFSNNISNRVLDIQKNNKTNYETAKPRHSMNPEMHYSINENNNSSDKQDADMMDLTNNTNGNLNMTDSNNNINIFIENNNNNNNTSNLASNGINNRTQTLFNDFNGNNYRINLEKKTNSNVNNNNFNNDSNNINKQSQNNYLINNNNYDTKIGLPSKNKIIELSQSNINQGINQTQEPNIVNVNIKLISNKDINNNNIDQNNKNSKINKKSNEPHMSNVFAAILENKNNNNNKDNNMYNNIDTYNNIFNVTSNQKINDETNIINSMNEISPVSDKRAYNPNNSNQSNSSSFNHDINNLNSINIKEKGKISNPFGLNNVNNNSSKNKLLFDDNVNNNHEVMKSGTTKTNINLVSPFSTIYGNTNTQNIIKVNQDSNLGNNTINDSNINKLTFGIKLSNTPNELNAINSQTNINMNNKNELNNNNSISYNARTQTDINSYADKNKNLNLASVIAEKIRDTQNELENNKLLNMGNNILNPVYEEVSESESELKNRNIEKKYLTVQYYLKKDFILCPIPGTTKIKIVTDDEKDENILTIFFPKDIGISCFLDNCAHCNYEGKLYISGGIIENNEKTNSNNNISTNKLFVIDLFQTSLEGENSFITELSPMSHPRNKHSMIGFGEYIYAVGGENSDTVERYDIKNNTWELLNPMINNRSYPNLFIYEGYLYAFFGKNNDGYVKNIERLNLTNPQSQGWEMILFDNPNEVDVRIYGCALYQVDELIYFFGGKYLEQDTDGIFFVNMKERLIDRTDNKLKWKESFRENTLFQLGNRFVQISDGKYYGTYLKVVVE